MKNRINLFLFRFGFISLAFFIAYLLERLVIDIILYFVIGKFNFAITIEALYISIGCSFSVSLILLLFKK